MNDSLPNNWSTCLLDDVIVKMSNGANVTQYDEKVGYPISRIETIWNENIDLDRVKYIKETNPDFIDKYALQCGDILLSHINSDSHLGKTGIYKKQVEVLIHGINILLIRPSTHISSDFLNYQFKHLRAKGIFINAAQRAVNQSSINQQKLKSFQIIIPPLPEQHRIAAKIEALFSELDKGVESFKAAREQLKIYRQSLLKHAFSGKLTAQWRSENQDKLETAEALLQRIQTEREQRYQQQLKDWEAIGRQGRNPNAPKPLPPLTTEELAELPELPTGWRWLKYGDLCSIVKNGISEKPTGNGTPIFRISAVRPLSFDMNDIRYTDNSTGRFNAYYLERGDLVFTRYNGSRQYVGVCAEYRSDEKRLFPDKLVQTRMLSKECLSSSYFEKALNCGATRKFLESKIRTTAGQSGVSGDDIKFSPVPICSIKEQLVFNCINSR